MTKIFAILTLTFCLIGGSLPAQVPDHQTKEKVKKVERHATKSKKKKSSSKPKTGNKPAVCPVDSSKIAPVDTLDKVKIKTIKKKKPSGIKKKTVEKK